MTLGFHHSSFDTTRLATASTKNTEHPGNAEDKRGSSDTHSNSRPQGASCGPHTIWTALLPSTTAAAGQHSGVQDLRVSNAGMPLSLLADARQIHKPPLVVSAPVDCVLQQSGPDLMTWPATILAHQMIKHANMISATKSGADD